ncbi:hypothetical protein SAMN05192550_1346 [Flavobacterium glycines]|nr:hypothetical protein [Flavobacterium glycines]OCB72195.1 hypothetical protein FBGL_05865 [Flavobacterium glycines]SDI98939.1 hypothetical protein SAMN05192550_1346 [Flavobacterium glycines]
MKNKIYSKNQIYAIIILFFLFVYTLFSFFKYENSIENGVLVEKKVICQTCRPYTKLSSGIMIKEGNKTYNIKLDYGNCIKYPVKSKIKVVYDKNRDIFIYPLKTPNYGKIYFLGILLLFSLIPWSLITNILKKV